MEPGSGYWVLKAPLLIIGLLICLLMISVYLTACGLEL
jgi:hypothetical protein